jgi:hypothetical protein
MFSFSNEDGGNQSLIYSPVISQLIFTCPIGESFCPYGWYCFEGFRPKYRIPSD